MTTTTPPAHKQQEPLNPPHKGKDTKNDDTYVPPKPVTKTERPEVFYELGEGSDPVTDK